MANNEISKFDQLAATLAHEVKNPVSLIRANIEFIEMTEKDSEYIKNFNVMKKELDKITCLVSDFMEYIKPIKESNIELIFISDLIREIVEDYDISHKSKNINFAIECQDEDISINGDYTKICILFYNIFKNAVEAIKTNGNIIAKIFKENNSVIIEISDNGAGIEKEHLSKIMNPFFTTKKEGSGLGLSICKNIVKEHNGSFEIVNNETSGCTSRVIFG